jgi:regulation of enolase protein 1 (concanavalin A-like superfamily)
MTATAASATQVDLAWLDNASDETGFHVERSTDGANFALIATAAADTTSFSDTTAAPATTYVYRVRAFNDKGESANAVSPAVSTPMLPPDAPTGLTATAAGTKIDLAWIDASSNEAGFTIERSSDGVSFAQIASVGANVTAYGDATAASGVAWTYRVRAFNNAGVSAYSNTASATLPIGLPAPWTKADIGSVGLAGSSTYSAGTYTLKGSGSDIAGTNDSFHFAYQAITGNFTITARVASMQSTNAWAKAGVMVRESLAANAKNAAVLVTPSNGITFQRRASTGGTTSSSTKSGLKAPYWVRLVRSGTTFTAYYSANGTTWTRLSSTTISMSSTVYVGLAVCAHNNTSLNTATFDNVSVTPA